MSANPYIYPTHLHEGYPASYEELLARDSRGIPEFLRARGATDVGPREIPTSWYLSREIHEREVERLWKRTWQMACREDDVPEVGDTWVYDIAGMSVVIVRVTSTTIKAFYNSCLHRGVTLRRCPGRVVNLQCPFHGFTWNLDGTFKVAPALDQFPQINPAEFKLPEVKVDRWGGFVFVNFDPDAGPLSEFLGGFVSEFTRVPFDNRVKRLHIQKILNANWKAAQEAFMEGYHVLTTHPQNTAIASDRCSQRDAFEHYSREILARAVPSEYMKRTPTAQKMYQVGMGRWDDDPDLPPIPAGKSAREAIADTVRERLRPVFGGKIDGFADAELVDTICYSLFPNLHPFWSAAQPMVYRFRPYGDDHTRSILEFMVLTPLAPGETPPLPAKVKVIAEHEDFNAAPEMGYLAAFLNQDINNLAEIMKGLRNNRRGKVNFSSNAELKIRHFYSTYQNVMGLSDSD